jgi:hypothetical protein
VVRTGNVSGTAAVRVQTKDGSARQGRDYDGVDEILRFEDGDAVRERVVSIFPNESGEPHETFQISLSSPEGANLGKTVNSSVLILATDETPPTLVKVEPPPGQSVRDVKMTVTGVAEDNRGVARVEVKLNGKKWEEIKTSKKGNQTTFGVELSAKPGMNTVEVRCFDERGNESAHVVRTYAFTQLRPMALRALPPSGGTVALNSSEALEKLEEGKAYSAVARPKPGMVFNGWSAVGMDLPSAFSNPVMFRMAKGLELTATFVPSPFGTTVVGNYAGLITPDAEVAPVHGNHGLVQMTVSATGLFSGLIRMDGDSFSFAGSFSPDGKALFSEGNASVLKIARRWRPALLFEASLDTDRSGGPGIAGRVGLELRSGGAAFAQFLMERAAFDGKSPATSVAAQSFAVKLDAPLPQSGRTVPLTESKGTLSVSKSGVATLGMVLADDTKFTVAAPLFQDERFAVYSGLYPGGRGSFSGNVFLRGAGGSILDLSPEMRWFRPYWRGGGAYVFGWEDGLRLPLRRVSDVIGR